MGHAVNKAARSIAHTAEGKSEQPLLVFSQTLKLQQCRQVSRGTSSSQSAGLDLKLPILLSYQSQGGPNMTDLRSALRTSAKSLSRLTTSLLSPLVHLQWELSKSQQKWNTLWGYAMITCRGAFMSHERWFSTICQKCLEYVLISLRADTTCGVTARFFSFKAFN